MPAYHEVFRTGEIVRIADTETLSAFRQDWIYHHPLVQEQLAYAGKSCFVRRVSYYHGGDCLYELSHWVLDTHNAPQTRYPTSHEENVPGFWHEACLREYDSTQWQIPLPLANEAYTVTAESRNNQPVVVVRTMQGMECLVMRHLQNEREAEAMTEVAALRNVRSFESRYNFQGVAQDALRQHAQERQKLQKASDEA